jgi:hypothetical protein
MTIDDQKRVAAKLISLTNAKALRWRLRDEDAETVGTAIGTEPALEVEWSPLRFVLREVKAAPGEGTGDDSAALRRAFGLYATRNPGAVVLEIRKAEDDILMSRVSDKDGIPILWNLLSAARAGALELDDAIHQFLSA